MRSRLRLGAVLAALGLAVWYLHEFAEHYPLAAIGDKSLEVALVVGARLVGLAIAYWMLASAVLLTIARLTAIPAAIRAVNWLTWRPLRRLIARSVASSLVIALSSSPVIASVSPGYVPVPAGDPPVPVIPTTTTASTTTIAPQPVTIPDPVDTLYVPIEAPRPTSTAVIPDAIKVVVRPGDNMWILAEKRLRELRGGHITDADTAPYWLAVIAANRNRIRSGDPDLIFPVEVLVLPAWN
ncbi:hypothetical protein BH18ACT5_BH18ACT5_06830 [soil metagenome]